MIKKYLKIFVLSLFLFNSSLSLVSAQTRSYSDPVSFTPQVTIPGSEFIKGKKYEMESNTTTLAKYVKAIYDYLLSIVGIAAAVVLMVGGIMWLTAGGSSERVGQAKSWISGSITGLVLALSSYLIMQTINPQLVSFTPTEVPKIKPIKFGCCQFETQSGKVAMDTTDSECYEIYTRKIKVKENGEFITKSFVINNLLSTTTNAALGDKSLAEYLKKIRFDQEMTADYKDNVCKESVYCIISSLSLGAGAELYTSVIEMPKERCNDDLPNNSNEWLEDLFRIRVPIRQPITYIKKDRIDESPTLKNILLTQCEGREGASCKNSLGNYCYCFGGKAYYNRGFRNEPCGNDDGICIPKKISNKLCKDEDSGGRSCGSGLVCCIKSKLSKEYDPSANY